MLLPPIVLILFENIVMVTFFFFNVYERQRERERGQRQRETQNPKQAPGSEMSADPDGGLELMNGEIMT